MSILKFAATAILLASCCSADIANFPGEQESSVVAEHLQVAITNNGIRSAADHPGETRQSKNGFGIPTNGIPLQLGTGQNRRRCPLCDSSVYPYCGEKLLHDACCCTDPYEYQLPYQCKLADCAFLHSNSCREHRLIANCCCNDQYRSLLRG